MKFVGHKHIWFANDLCDFQGGNSRVYIVKKEDSDEKFALKLFKADVRDEKRKNRFLDEIQTLQNIQSVEGCVKYFDHGVTDNEVPFVVTLYYENHTFAKYYFHDQPKEQVSVTLKRILKAVEIISKLHNRNPKISIRDLKPQNIFLDKDLNPIVGDFGLSLFSDAKEEERHTSTGNVVGSHGYRPPESSDTKAASDHTSGDIWSLARTIWAIFARRNPPNDFESLSRPHLHLEKFMPPEPAKLIHSLFRECESDKPEERISIDEFRKSIEEIMPLIVDWESGKKRPSNIDESLKDLSRLRSGSSRLTVGEQLKTKKTALDKEINDARECLVNELTNLKKKLSKNLSKDDGEISIIDQNSSGGYKPISLSISGMPRQVGMNYIPPHIYSIGGSRSVTFSFHFGVDIYDNFFWYETSDSGDGDINMSKQIYPKSLIVLATQKANGLEKFVLDWMVPNIKKQF